MSMLRMESVCLQAGGFSLEGVSMNVANGEYYVLTGPNGAGKSLLMLAVCGLLPISSGAICINEKDVTHLPPRFRGIGYVPQRSDLFPHLSVRQNISFSLDVTRQSAGLIRAKVHELVTLLGIEHLVERSTINLSGGERQKVALARALAGGPKLLIMDEPLTEIDEESRNRVCHDLRAIQRKTGITTMHISHSRTETELVADRIGLLKDGCLASNPT